MHLSRTLEGSGRSCCLISRDSKHLPSGRRSRSKGRTTLSRSERKNEAFLTLLLPLQRSLEVYSRRMLRNASDTEDALQNSIMTAFARFDRYVEGTNFRAWMFRFVTLEIFNRNRKRKPSTGEEFAEAVVDRSPENSSELEARWAMVLNNPDLLRDQFEDHVAAALDQLTAAERGVLLLRAVGEFSYHEMHEILSIPLGSVMGYLSRARQKMRMALGKYAAEHGLVRRQETRP
jgi:RNA polymerase sigma-70 factor, ECF subfamily